MPSASCWTGMSLRVAPEAALRFSHRAALAGGWSPAPSTLAALEKRGLVEFRYPRMHGPEPITGRFVSRWEPTDAARANRAALTGEGG